MQKVILRVGELNSQTQWGTTKVRAEPFGEILYAIEVPDGYEETEDGVVFDANGMRHILRGLQVILSFDTKEEAF